MKDSVDAVLCARTGSERFPGKVLQDIAGQNAIEWQVERLRLAECINRIIVATTTLPEDDAIFSVADRLGLPVFRGQSEDVVERFGLALDEYAPDYHYVYRAMSDQPFTDWEMLDEIAALVQANQWDFVLPLSLDMDVVYGAGPTPWSRRAWEYNRKHAQGDEREHPGMTLRRNLSEFSYGLLSFPHWMYSNHRLELDTAADLSLFRMIYRSWQGGGPPPLKWVVGFLNRDAHLSMLNAHVVERTGTFTSYTADEIRQWHEDFEGRPIVWQELTGLMAIVQDVGKAYTCDDCGGVLAAVKIGKRRPNGHNHLLMRCIRCGKEQKFYAEVD